MEPAGRSEAAGSVQVVGGGLLHLAVVGVRGVWTGTGLIRGQQMCGWMQNMANEGCTF